MVSPCSESNNVSAAGDFVNNYLNDMLNGHVSMDKLIISKQSDVDVKIVMRSIFLQHSPNLNYNIPEQIKYLDQMVTDWCVPRIIAEINQYVGYISDISTLPMPIDLPQNLSSKGTKISRSITSTF